MTGYLLDTNVVSVFAPGRPGDPLERQRLAAWLEERTEELFLSAVTVLEVQTGVDKARRKGSPRADQLARWLDRVLDEYGDRIVPFDLIAGRLAGSLADAARAQGRDPGLADIMIAATALAHGHTMVTRNVAHFRWPRLSVCDPFAS